jgi:hypothetical protein
MDNVPIFWRSLSKRARTRNATPLPNSLNSSAHEVRSFRGLFRCSTIPAQKSAHPFSGIDQPGLPATFPSRHPQQLMTSCRVRAKAAAEIGYYYVTSVGCAKPLHSDMLPHRDQFILLENI